MSEDHGTNEYGLEEIGKYLKEIDAADDQLLELKSAHMTACKVPRAKIRETMTTAKEAGLRMPAFRAIVAKHRAERKIDAQIAELEADDRADFEKMKEALGEFGDTPLGEAALARAKAADGDRVLSSL